MAQWVRRLTVDFGSGRDLTVSGMGPRVWHHVLSLSLKKTHKNPKVWFEADIPSSAETVDVLPTGETELCLVEFQSWERGDRTHLLPHFPCVQCRRLA